MKCFLSKACMEGMINNAVMKNKLQIKLFAKNKMKKCHRIMSGGFTRLGKQVQKHEKNKLPPEEEVDLESREKVTQQALQRQPQEQGEIPARRRPRVHSRPGAEARLVDRFTFESFWRPLMWHWGIPTAGLWTTLICLLQNICPQLVCLSLNKTWFLYTAIIELASGIHASLLHYQVNSFLGFWLMPKYMILESKDSHKHSEPRF